MTAGDARGNPAGPDERRDGRGVMLTRRFLTVKEVAELVQVSEATVRHWIKQRDLRAIALGREWRVIPHDLEAFLGTHETRSAAGFPGAAADGTTAMPGSQGEAAPDLPADASEPQDARRNH
ncbi:helix-turn-helix domain-containing protein [Roseomonas alba]|nr:helix-turn-helix domain-containing protein [Neoroseomonas alba]